MEFESSLEIRTRNLRPGRAGRGGLSTVTPSPSIETATLTVDRRGRNLLSTNYLSYFAWHTYCPRPSIFSESGAREWEACRLAPSRQLEAGKTLLHGTVLFLRALLGSQIVCECVRV